MSGDRLGHLSLRADALYCAATALLVCALSPVVAPAVGTTWPVVFVVGVAVGGWAAFLWLARPRLELRVLLRIVLVANVAAAAAVAVGATLLSSIALTVLLAAVAVEVAAFALSQAVALGRLQRSA